MAGAGACTRLLLGICSPCGVGGRAEEDAADDAPAPTNVVDVPRHYRFSPKAIVESAGTEAKWRNSDDFIHTVRIDGAGDEPLRIEPGDSASMVFAESGEYPNVCTLHAPQMSGRAVVPTE